MTIRDRLNELWQCYVWAHAAMHCETKELREVCVTLADKHLNTFLGKK